MNPFLTPEILAQLKAYASYSVANAIDATGVRLANEGFCDDRITCRTPALPPMVGTVVTLKVRSADPSMKNAFYLEQGDWWERLEPAAEARVLAIQDIDVHPGKGALVGPVHACILKAMGFVGVMTNGAIRGRHKFEEIGLAGFAAHLSPAHAFSHVIELGTPIVLAGLTLKSGDLVHGGEDGVVKVPAAIAERVAALAKDFREREKRICELCNAKDFSPATLRRQIGTDASRR